MRSAGGSAQRRVDGAGAGEVDDEAPRDAHAGAALRQGCDLPEAPPPGARRAADSLGEQGAERAEAGEADLEAGLGDRGDGGRQQRLGPLDAQAGEVLGAA
nr:hypothetical protein [Nannocystis exedens]